MSANKNMITSAEMHALDINCNYYGLDSPQLMENAGAALAREVRKKCKRGRVLVVAGSGNNGGDGVVAARHLTGDGTYSIKVILLGTSDSISTAEASHNWNLLRESGADTVQVQDSVYLDANDFKSADVIVDAILGTGVRGAVREPAAAAIGLINDSNAKVIAVDAPSGLNPDTGEYGEAVRADITVTFHRAKPGLKNKNAAGVVGRIAVADIGIPPIMELLAGPGDLSIINRRTQYDHKGDNGRILIIGGGAYTGAPALAGMAALRAGADIVTIAAPRSVSDVIASFSPNLIVKPLSGDILSPEDVPLVEQLMESHDAAVIGPGLGRVDETVKAVRSLLKNRKMRFVVDADALSMIQPPLSRNIIVTPHRGEFERLGGPQLPEEMDERNEALRAFASEIKCTILLKSPVDVVSDGRNVRINVTGNAGMTVGGTGDVLAGVTGAFYAVHSDALRAAAGAAFIVGCAGDLAYEDLGSGLLATDVIDMIPVVLKDLVE